MPNKIIYPMKYNTFNQVVEANELIRATQHDMSVLEAKLLRLTISQILKSDTNLKTYTANVAELSKQLHISKDNIYREAKELGIDLLSKVIVINGKKDKLNNTNYRAFHWVDTIEYRDGNFTIKLSDDLIPYLTQLNELFTQYYFNEISVLPTTNSIRLYELLMSYKGKFLGAPMETDYIPPIELKANQYIFTIDYLKRFFNCESKYTNNSGFVSRVIDRAVKAINQKIITRSIKYDVLKTGAKITHIIFTMER